LIQRPSSFDALSALGKRKQLHVLVFESWLQYGTKHPTMLPF